jgi:hypothetical protein
MDFWTARDMDYALESDGQQRLEEYFERIGNRA